MANIEGFSTAIAVRPKCDTEHIVFPLEDLGSISGTVVDEPGEALQQIEVYLFAKRVLDGRWGTYLRQELNTDSNGHFDFGDLPSGVYFVAANGQPWYAQHRLRGQQQDSELDMAYPVTYYDDTTDPKSATPIRLTGGAAETIQIALRAVPAVHVELQGIMGKSGAFTGLPVFRGGSRRPVD